MADCLHIRCEVYPDCQFPATCPARNEALGHRCDRPAGHAGAHVQDDGWAQIGWGWTGERRQQGVGDWAPTHQVGASPRLGCDDGGVDTTTVCERCGTVLHVDVWGRFVDRLLGLTCKGDRLHVPVRVIQRTAR